MMPGTIQRDPGTARGFIFARPAIAARRRGPLAPALFLLLFSGLIGPLRTMATVPMPIRFGFSSQIFVGLNENDARAALKIWVQTISTERGIPADPGCEIFADAGTMKAALLEKRIDAVSMTILEYWALRRSVPLGPIILGRQEGKLTEEYVLLVHRDSQIQRLEDLRGRHLGQQQGPRSGLVSAWLETMLLERGLGTAGTFWGRTTQAGNLTRIVLPVFFHQLDACVVTLEGFRTMSELNPQVGQQLKILAQSPPLVSAPFCFRGDLESTARDKLIADIPLLIETTAGRQAMTLFHSDRLTVCPVSDLDETCALLDRHQRLLAEAGSVRTANPSGPARPENEESSP